MSTPQTAALVLAGGQSRRMGGGDKPLLMLHGRPMLDHVLAALDGLPSAISANGDPSRFSRYRLPVLPDKSFAGQGPLAGVLAGLEWAAALGMTALLTVPGDTPFLPLGLADALAPAPASVSCGGQRHHLVALWPIGIRVFLQTFLSHARSSKVSCFAECVGMRYVDFPAERTDLFANVNTPDDLARLEAMAGNGTAMGRV